MAAMLPFDADAIAPKNSVREINQLAGRSGRARTCDPRFWRPVLYQLSYTPTRPCVTAVPRRFKHREWPDCKGAAQGWTRLPPSAARLPSTDRRAAVDHDGLPGH